MFINSCRTHCHGKLFKDENLARLNSLGVPEDNVTNLDILVIHNKNIEKDVKLHALGLSYLSWGWDLNWKRQIILHPCLLMCLPSVHASLPVGLNMREADCCLKAWDLRRPYWTHGQLWSLCPAFVCFSLLSPKPCYCTPCCEENPDYTWRQ